MRAPRALEVRDRPETLVQDAHELWVEGVRGLDLFRVGPRLIGAAGEVLAAGDELLVVAAVVTGGLARRGRIDPLEQPALEDLGNLLI